MKVSDSFRNFSARLGWGADNQLSHASYGTSALTRDRTQLEAMYRSSWLVGQAVDVMAEDMTRAGIDIVSALEPGQTDILLTALRERGVWDGLTDALRWSRLYGGALAVLLIDGQDPSRPLNLDTLAPGSFRGLLVLDRWMVQPNHDDPITALGPDLGRPRFYHVLQGAPALAGAMLHHSRCLRLEGIPLPHAQRCGEDGWGQSVVERLFDRLVAFDSASLGAAQMAFKSHLRTYKVDGLREIVAAGGRAMEALLKQVDMIRQSQCNEGLTLMDGKDEFITHSYGFSGLSDLLLQFGQQISGALGIPLVRLFGQSPAGFSATGESDLRTYYDNIRQGQESRLRRPLALVLEVLCRSELGVPPPSGFHFGFTPLWQISAAERASIAEATARTVINAHQASLIDRGTALRELRETSRLTGLFSNVTDQDIRNGDNIETNHDLRSDA